MAYDGKNRKIKAGETREKIYESAKKLFAARDYNEISVDAIVKMAGVSKGSFYVHFASKGALFTALINEQVAEVDQRYQRFLESIPKDASAEHMLLSLIGEIADVLTNNLGRDAMKALYKVQISGDFDTGTVSSYDRQIYKIFSNVLERGISRGEFKSDIPLDMMTTHLLTAIRGVTYEWCIRGADFDYKAQALRHFELILEGLRANPSTV